MALTYAQLSTALQEWTQTDETAFVSNIPVMVRAAEDRVYHTLMFDALRKHATGSLTISVATLTLPLDFIAPLSMTITVASSLVPLRQKSIDFLNEYNPTGAAGAPKYYALKSDTVLVVAPTPASGYAYDLQYFFKPESIVTASTSWLGNFHESLLLYGSLVEAYTFLKGEDSILGSYQSRYMEEIAKLKNTGEAKQMTDTYRSEIRKDRQ